MKITKCPTCGSRKIKSVKRDLVRKWHGQRYVVPNLEFSECPDCGEMVFSPEAVRRVREVSPAYQTARAEK